MKNWYCMEHYEYFLNMKKHLQNVKHRCKLYSPHYEDLCHYKNCISFAQFDGFCPKHFEVVVA